MKKLKKVAAITMARDDTFFLSRWIAYYGKQFGTENLYILLDGIDQEIPENAGNAHIKKLPHEDMSRAMGDKYRINKLSEMAHKLLKTYDIVIGCDSDEFLIVDPNTTELFIDRDSKVAYVKSADQMGFSTTKAYRLEELTEEEQNGLSTPQKVQNLDGYVTKEAFESFTKRVSDKIGQIESRFSAKELKGE